LLGALEGFFLCLHGVDGGGLIRGLLHHLETAKAGLYSLGSADSASIIQNGRYLILNSVLISRLPGSEIVPKRFLNVQYEFDIQDYLGEHIGIGAEQSIG
jgi:hypothetical protein